jgi:PhnB protein
MPSVNPYLVFDGNCADAMRFYERVLGGKLERMMTFGEMPEQDKKPAPGTANRIAHARLDLKGGVLMASDTMPNYPYEGMKGFSVSLTYSTAAESKRIYDALAEGAKQVTMPFQKTFWSEGFGMLTDRFGTPWMVNTETAHG